VSGIPARTSASHRSPRGRAGHQGRTCLPAARARDFGVGTSPDRVGLPPTSAHAAAARADRAVARTGRRIVRRRSKYTLLWRSVTSRARVHWSSGAALKPAERRLLLCFIATAACWSCHRSAARAHTSYLSTAGNGSAECASFGRSKRASEESERRRLLLVGTGTAVVGDRPDDDHARRAARSAFERSPACTSVPARSRLSAPDDFTNFTRRPLGDPGVVHPAAASYVGSAEHRLASEIRFKNQQRSPSHRRHDRQHEQPPAAHATSRELPHSGSTSQDDERRQSEPCGVRRPAIKPQIRLKERRGRQRPERDEHDRATYPDAPNDVHVRQGSSPPTGHPRTSDSAGERALSSTDLCDSVSGRRRPPLRNENRRGYLQASPVEKHHFADGCIGGLSPPLRSAARREASCCRRRHRRSGVAAREVLPVH